VTNDRRPPLALPDSAPLAVPEGFGARLAAIGVTLGAEMLAQLGDYLGRLLAMNELMNLTGIKTAEEAWERHVLDALALIPLRAEVPAGARVVDIGSGGGLPGVPLAIARPDLRVALVEATQKKAAFLSSVAGAMGLANVSVHGDRAERLGREELCGAFDVVTARAVGRLAVLVPLVLPFAKVGGVVLLIKGERAPEELAEAKKVLAQQKAAHETTVVTPTGRIVVLRRSA